MLNSQLPLPQPGEGADSELEMELEKQLRHFLLSSTAFILVSALLTSATLHAQDARLQGVFVNPTQSGRPIKKAVEEGAAQFSFLMRPIARSRLQKTNPNINRVEIVRSSEEFTITLGISKPSTARPDGPAIKWSRDDEVFDLALAWEGMTLAQSFTAPDGKRSNRYTLSPDGNSLSLEITLTSDMLKKPVKYTLSFIREETRP